MNINTVKDAKKYLLSLFDNEDVFIEKEKFGDIVVRPSKEYNKNHYRSFLLRIPSAGKSVRTAERIITGKAINCFTGEAICCSNVMSYDLDNPNSLKAAIFQIKNLIVNYNEAIKNLKILHKNKKIAEIRTICDKFTV